MLLEVEDLRARYHTGTVPVEAVAGVSFAVDKGENLGLVGESGSGKTTLIRSLLGLLGSAGRATGRVALEGTDLLSLAEPELRRIRGARIALVAQSAMNSLDPVYRVGDQVVETIRAHEKVSRASARARAAQLFRSVGLDPARLDDYPHQMSGGMKQRTVIAMALALGPDLILADEPTTALDVVVQDGILVELRKLQASTGSSMILVTHDVSVVAQTCQRIAVMYAGQLVEIGDARRVLGQAAHPYTMGLLNAFPTIAGSARELISIPGSPPSLAAPPDGCRFAARCPFATDRCRSEEPVLREVSAGHLAACHYSERADELRVMSGRPETWYGDEQPPGRVAQSSGPGSSSSPLPLISCHGVEKRFPLRRRFGEVLARAPRRTVQAVNGIDLDVMPAEVVGVAGESGSGKSTLSEMMVGLQQPSAGEIVFGRDGRDWRSHRRDVQMVFQDPYETLNPRFTVRQAIAEPLRNLDRLDLGAHPDKIELAMSKVGLSPPEEYLERYPHELSGGQRQRVAIARAIVLEPRFLVADEPVSMLDVSIRAGILELFRRFRDELGMGIVYVSHDLATVRYVTDRTAIMYLGRIVESGPTEEVISRPRHPYTELLIAAVPKSGFEDEPRPSGHIDFGETPDAIELQNGCSFHNRCPYALAHCGWEGRDLMRLLAATKDDLGSDARESEATSIALDLAGSARIDGLDLVIDHVEDAEAGVSFLTRLMEESNRPAMARAATVEEHERGIRVRFPSQAPPAVHEPVAGVRVQCHLYSDGSDAPLVIRTAATDNEEGSNGHA